MGVQLNDASNSQAFWTSIVQIIPVVALAVVLEARFFSRQWSKKKLKKEDKSRTRNSYLLYSFAVLLPLVEIWGLGYLLAGVTNHVFEILAVAVVFVALFFLIQLPIQEIALITITPTLMKLEMRNPFSVRRKTLRTLDVIRDEILRARPRIWNDILTLMIHKSKMIRLGELGGGQDEFDIDIELVEIQKVLDAKRDLLSRHEVNLEKIKLIKADLWDFSIPIRRARKLLKRLGR
jgi:hypothetical protein